MATTANRLYAHLRLIRLDKPIGSLLLLLPTFNALWIASEGRPGIALVCIFLMGTLLMRSAGCAINDYADREFDRHVERTVNRPVTSGAIRPGEALVTATLCAALASLLLLPLNARTQGLAVPAVILAATYPFTKRFFALPQAYLGLAFGFGIPMAFAAARNAVPPIAWLLLIANVFWSVAYDTAYAMVDRDDDRKIGIRTAAITFGRFDVLAVMFCYVAMLIIYAWVGMALHFGLLYWLGWLGAAGCACYYYLLIRHRDRASCLAAFHHNKWLGAFLFAGIVGAYAVR